MDKRLEKRHKRQVARARAKGKVSEPDIRTPQQIREARDASRPQTGRREPVAAHSSTPPAQRVGGPAVNSNAKTAE